jgi:hypothetical protein
MTERDWRRAFDDPTLLQDSPTLSTSSDAGHYIAGLPEPTQELPESQTACKGAAAWPPTQ